MSEAGSTPPSQRLLSLDALRGMTIAVMLLVNNPGSWSNMYAPLAHARWEGCTLADLVFPFFLFCVGAAMELSFARIRQHNISRVVLLRKVIVRGALLFGLGFTLNILPIILHAAFSDGTWSELKSIRIMGVLQRIGLAFIGAAFIYILLPRFWQYVVGAIILILYFIMLGKWPIFEAHNAAVWIDSLVLPAANMYRGGPLDPEGLTSTLPAIVSVLLGAWIIRLLVHRSAIQYLMITGVACMLCSGALATVQPPIKPLWNPAYVLLTTGLASCCLGILHAVAYNNSNILRPLIVFGSNALFAFFMSGVVARLLGYITFTNQSGEKRWLSAMLYSPFEAGFANPNNASLAYALTTVVVWYFMHEILFRKGIYWKV